MKKRNSLNAFRGLLFTIMWIVTLTVSAQSITVTGNVKDDSGMEVIGATIIVSGDASKGTVTDIDGNYVLNNISSNATLTFSYVGLKSQNVSVNGRTKINVVLKTDAELLDEIVVVGYGTNTKRTMISSVSQVNSDEIQNVPVGNITQSLAGKTPGLIVQSSGGGVNNKARVSIRGGGTPLVVIDGIIREYSDFTALNPTDIATFSILKDASATAVYGSRASNGIIQITTHRGKNAAPVAEYNYSQVWGQPTILPKKLDSYGRAFYRNVALKNDGLPLEFTDNDLKLYQDGSDPFGHPNTDWQKLTLRNWAPQTKHNVKVIGGNEISNYYISLGQLHQGSLYKSGRNYLDRTNFRLSQSTDIEPVGLNITAQADGYFQSEDEPYTSEAVGYGTIFATIINKSPREIGINKNGEFYDQANNTMWETSKDAGYIRKKEKVFNGQLNLTWDVPGVEGLRLKGNGSYRYFIKENKSWRNDPARYTWEGTTPIHPGKPSLSQSAEKGNSYTVQFFGDYNKQFGLHSLSLLGGYEATYNFSDYMWLSRESYNFPIDQINVGPATTMQNSGWEAESGRAGWIGQIKYNYDNKYIAEAGMRYDGSDNFPKDKRWGTFYSGSLGWSIGDEAFMESLREKDVFNMLKIRGSYGQVGLDNWGQQGDPFYLSRFAYLPSYNFNSQSYVINGIMQPGFSEGAIPSPDISWFSTQQTDVGFDFSSLNSRLYGSADYFFYKTTGFLYAPDPLDVGYVDPLGISLPKMRTDGEQRREGFEFQLGWRDKIDQFTYDLTFNFTMFDELWAKNPVESLENKKNPYKRTTQQTGYNSIAYKSLGYYIDQNDVLTSPRRLNSTNITAGDIKYYDFNGDGVIDGADQIRVGKNQFPRGNWGFNINMGYKGFSLRSLFQGTTAHDRYLGETFRMNYSQTGTSPVYDFQKDYWTPDNTNARFPRLISTGGTNSNHNAVSSDFWLINATYFRLKNLDFSYNFKHKMLKNVNWISKLDVGISGNNVFTVSKFFKYGMDPETADNNNHGYPNERSFAINVNIGF